MNWMRDISLMHDYYDHTSRFDTLDDYSLSKLLEFRIKFLDEELTEIKGAKSPEDVVDGLIDLVVVAIGTLDAFGIDGHEAWDEVLAANMAKETGIKPERPNPLGLPDLIKPEGWAPPSHAGNHGTLERVFNFRSQFSPCDL